MRHGWQGCSAQYTVIRDTNYSNESLERCTSVILGENGGMLLMDLEESPNFPTVPVSKSKVVVEG